MSHDHDFGLRHDLETMLSRRKALGLLVSAAGAGLSLAAAATGARAESCVAIPRETKGPFPADGSNRVRGTLANVLTDSGIVRSDMRGDLSGAGAAAEGVDLRLTVSLVTAAAACAPLPGRAIYLWHCDAAGRYSIYNLPDRSYLRAVGITDSAGKTEFRTIVPGCYRGRFPHMHFEIYRDLAAASDYRNSRLTSQLIMPADACGAVYAKHPAYRNSLASFARMPFERDRIFANNSPEQVAQQTAAFELQPDGSYQGRITIAIAPEAV